MNAVSPHFLSGTVLSCCILMRDSYSICENRRCQFPPVASSVISIKCPSKLGVSIFMAPYQPLMEDSGTKILSSVFNWFIQG